MVDAISVTTSVGNSDDCVISNDIELLSLEGCSSKIWKYFRFPGKDSQYIEKDKQKRNEATCGCCNNITGTFQICAPT